MAIKEQVSVCLRTVDDEFHVEEYFVGFYETVSMTAEVLVNVNKDVLQRCDLKLSHCRGQTYDDQAAMSGVKTGVATRIQAEEKRALIENGSIIL